jgi:hypothetical protein
MDIPLGPFSPLRDCGFYEVVARRVESDLDAVHLGVAWSAFDDCTFRQRIRKSIDGVRPLGRLGLGLRVSTPIHDTSNSSAGGSTVNSGRLQIALQYICSARTFRLPSRRRSARRRRSYEPVSPPFPHANPHGRSARGRPVVFSLGSLRMDNPGTTNRLVAATIYELLCPSGKRAPAPRNRSPERGRTRPTEPA